MKKNSKKYLKQMMPFLIALKVKLSLFAALAYVVIALIAKKALLASLISLAVSGFIGIKKLLANQHHAPHHEVVSRACFTGGKTVRPDDFIQLQSIRKTAE